MTKTLKDFLEVYKPKSPDEQKFVDKHVVIKHKDRNGNGDDVFNGNTKTAKRKEERHGYDVGEDEKVYEALKGDQHKIDANKNGKVDAHDFHLLRKKKKVAEEAGELEELSKSTMGAYTKKAAADFTARKPKMGYDGQLKKMQNRTVGVNRALNKMYGEEVDGVDESYQELMALKNNIARNQKKMNSIPGIHPEKKRLAIQIEKDTKRHKALFNKQMGKNEEVDIDTVLDEALDLLNSIDEKTLTPAEMKKREEVVKAIKRDDPKMDKSMAYAVATKTAKRVAEGTMPSADEPTEANKKTAQKIRDMMAKEKKPVKEEADDVNEQVDIDKYADSLIKRDKRNLSKSHVVHAARVAGVDHKKLLTAVQMKVGRIKEETEELDESAKIAAHLIKRYGDNVRKSHVVSAANDFGVDASKLAKAVRTKLGKTSLAEDEQIDELSSKKLTDYMDKASDARGHRNLSTKKVDNRYAGVKKASDKITTEEQMSPEDHYKADLPHILKDIRGKRKGHSDLRREYGLSWKRLANSTAAEHGHNYNRGHLLAVGKQHMDKHMQEEVQIDELSKATMGRYINKAKNSIDLTAWRQGHKEAGAGSPSRALERKLSKRHIGIEKAVNKLTKEEADQIDELSKDTMGRYINKAATKMGSQGVTAGLKIAADEKSSKNFKDMGKREKGIKLAVSKLTKEDIINRTIEKYVPEDLKFTPEERLLKRLDGLSEAHVNTLMGLFEALNSDNQNKMIATVESREGINQLLNFALDNRGE